MGSGVGSWARIRDGYPCHFHQISNGRLPWTVAPFCNSSKDKSEGSQDPSFSMNNRSLDKQYYTMGIHISCIEIMQSVYRTRLPLSGKAFPRGRQPCKKIWTASAITLTVGRSPKLDPKLSVEWGG